MKKGKTITFQLQDQFEKDLFNYCNELHNFSGTIKRIIGESQGFKDWKEAQKRRSVTIVGSSNNSGVVKFTL
jgi:hypothetical protein